MGHVGHKLLAHGLILDLLGYIVDHRQDPRLLLPVEGNQQQKENPVAPDGLAVQAVSLQVQNSIQGGDLPKQVVVAHSPAYGDGHV